MSSLTRLIREESYHHEQKQRLACWDILDELGAETCCCHCCSDFVSKQAKLYSVFLLHRGSQKSILLMVKTD